jgi:WD40 repeat protein
VDFDPSGQLLASVSRDFTLKVYDYESGVLLHSILLGRESPKCVLFWDAETVLVGNYWGDVWRVDLGSEKVTAYRLAINGISSLARSGSFCIAASYDGSICLLNPADMSVIERLHCMHQKLPEYETRASFD